MQIYTCEMSDYKKKQLEYNFIKFIKKYFEQPCKCRNIGQVQFYVKELVARKIEKFKSGFNYTPKPACILLIAYNTSRKNLTLKDFQKTRTR